MMCIPASNLTQECLLGNVYLQFEKDGESTFSPTCTPYTIRLFSDEEKGKSILTIHNGCSCKSALCSV